jgi:hypothetical protein
LRPERLMLRSLLAILLIVPMSLPPGLCLCQCAAGGDDGDGHACPACALGAHHDDCACPCHGGGHPTPDPADQHNGHAPGCPVLKTSTGFSPTPAGNVFPPDGTSHFALAAVTNPVVPTESPVAPARRAHPGDQPIYLTLLTLRI